MAEYPLGVSVKVDASDLLRIEGALKQMGFNIRRPIMFLEGAGVALMSEVERAFREEADPTTGNPWPDLKDVTRAGRRGAKKGMTADRASRQRYSRKAGTFKGGKHKGAARFTGAKLLQDKGRLKASIGKSVVASPPMVIVGSNLVYSRIHHFGGRAGRGLKTKIPPRPYLPSEWKGRFEKAVLRALIAQMKQGPVGRYLQYVAWNRAQGL